MLKMTPTEAEIKSAVFELNRDSVSGPDGFTGHFFQTFWDIVGGDMINVVNAFFAWYTLSKSIAHTNLILLPKKEKVLTLFDLRPTSLSNFMNKVISRIFHDRLEVFLPKLISQNQNGFMKGRSITENVLLAQEIVADIRKKREAY